MFLTQEWPRYKLAGALRVVLSPACDAVTVQLPVLDRVTMAEETP